MADLMAGLVDIYFGGLSTALPHVRAGKIRALGQTSLTRSAAAPISRPSPNQVCRATRLRSPTASSCRPPHRRSWSTACMRPSTPRFRSPEVARKSPTSRRSPVRHACGIRRLRRQRSGEMGPPRQGGGPQDLTSYLTDENASAPGTVGDVGHDGAVLLGLGALVNLEARLLGEAGPFRQIVGDVGGEFRRACRNWDRRRGRRICARLGRTKPCVDGRMQGGRPGPAMRRPAGRCRRRSQPRSPADLIRRWSGYRGRRPNA